MVFQCDCCSQAFNLFVIFLMFGVHEIHGIDVFEEFFPDRITEAIHLLN